MSPMRTPRPREKNGWTKIIEYGIKEKVLTAYKKINIKKKALWLKNEDKKHLLLFLSSPNNWKMEEIEERRKIAETDLTKEF